MEDALSGLTFCVTGEPKEMSLDNVEELIRYCGARLTNKISRFTNYLVVGDTLPDGRQVNETHKYQDALHRNTPMITVDQLCKMIAKGNHEVYQQALNMEFEKPEPEKYTLEFAKSGKASCTLCKNIIPKGRIRLKAVFKGEGRRYGWSFYRCLNCVTRKVLVNIEADWKDRGGLVSFLNSQSPEVLHALNPHASKAENVDEFLNMFVASAERIASMKEHEKEERREAKRLQKKKGGKRKKEEVESAQVPTKRKFKTEHKERDEFLESIHEDAIAK